ncbi:hypothetical protein EJ05DRAFT_472144 [Pseudovirgaria hyperparasitica]|uniref:Methyltransferase n=1 Tax=Pseudovirgaria hyperparasitica TaxID=470096 RepID=A0A6A6WLZ1_9PEZI|nr:uncharacterized protein EJ05DRAFT_472144 [Pseudovirgaria hyperparasitica]KAF2763230.1 hypothetical protein EJ05DRAFT_472144 [Pseudovirgaria hyperparasitica]
MTRSIFKHIDPTSYTGKPWGKVDGPGRSFKLLDHERPVNNIRGRESEFTTENSGFEVLTKPATEKLFTNEEAVRTGYYAEVETLLKEHLPGVKKVVIFDHTIRRRTKDAPRQPVQNVHVDQTPDAADTRVRRHCGDEAEELLKNRYSLINVWRPIENPASDFPLAVIDWRTTSPSDFIKVDLMYPKREDSVVDDDDRGKEKLADPSSWETTEGYEVKGETLAVAGSDKHQFYYEKDMTPDQVMLLKCYDSHGDGRPGGKAGRALRTPHTAFVDPETPTDAPGRQSIEVRCLVFYEEGY